MDSANQSERYSLRDASGFAVMLGCAEAYFSAFAVYLNASTMQLGILATVPVFIGNLFHVAGVWLSDRLKYRRKPIALGALIHACTLLPIAAIALFQPESGRIVFFFTCLLGFYMIQGLIVPSWNAWIGDIIDPGRRAVFFARRTRRVSLWTFVSTLTAGTILSYWQSRGLESAGFTIIFLIAASARAFSSYSLSKHDDPEYHCDHSERFSFVDFIRRSGKSNFVRFAFFYGSVNFGVAFASPYFAPYMLRDLSMSYGYFTAVIGAGVISQVIALIYWANLSNKLGNKRILEICGYGVSLVPVLWFVSPALWYLLIIQIFSGLGWSGFNLAAQNFLFEAVSPQKRARCSAYLMVINGSCVLSGSLLGGFVSKHLPTATTLLPGPTGTSVLLWIFLISGVIRFLAIRVFLHKFKEVREVETASLYSVMLRPAYIRAVEGFRFGVLPFGKKEQ